MGKDFTPGAKTMPTTIISLSTIHSINIKKPIITRK